MFIYTKESNTIAVQVESLHGVVQQEKGTFTKQKSVFDYM